MSANLEKLSASQIGAMVNNKVISPVESVEYSIKKIEESNKEINAFVDLHFEDALRQARKLESDICRGKADKRCFNGVPFALKDFLDSKPGWEHTYGGVMSMKRKDMEYSEFCRAMEDMGGIAIGKTNSPAFGFSGICWNKTFGATKNPHNTKYNSGGSSGGSAAAVAAGMVPIAEGGDAGGSIRIPAAWCGVYGFKPSAGVIPNVCRPDAWSATHPYCTNFGITSNMKDTEILYWAMRGYDPRDPISIPHPCGNIRCSDTLRIGYSLDMGGLFKVTPEVEKAFNQALKTIGSLNFRLEPVDMSCRSNLEELTSTWCQGLAIDSAIQFHDEKHTPDDAPESFLKMVESARNMTIMDYSRFHKVRTNAYDMQQDVFRTYDLLITPVTCCQPILNGGNELGPEAIGDKSLNELIGFAETFIWNMTGNPAMALPFGKLDGMPFAIQVIAPRFQDEQLLDFARLLDARYCSSGESEEED